jgi:hypothetical protein
LAIGVVFIVRQRCSERFEQRSLIFPVGLGAYGAVTLTGAANVHPSRRPPASVARLLRAGDGGISQQDQDAGHEKEATTP